MSPLLLSKTLEEINRQMNIDFLKFFIFVIVLVVFSLLFGRFMRRIFKLEHPRDVHGYIRNRYVNKAHQVGSFILHSTLTILIAYMGIKSSIDIDLLVLAGINLFIMGVFDVFMYWRYPIQKNEYKESIVSFIGLYIIIILLFRFLLVDWIV